MPPGHPAPSLPSCPAEATGAPGLHSRQILTLPRRSHTPWAAIGDAQMKGFVRQALARMGIPGFMGGPWKSSVATGVRTTAATAVPLVVGQLVGDTTLAMMVAVGGLNVSLSDIGGPYRTKAITMGVATVSLAAAAYLGTAFGRPLWLSLPVVCLLAAAAGLAGLYGNGAAKGSYLSLILFILTLGMPAGVA